MTIADETEETRAEGGKPDLGVRGRTTTTVRLTAARLADLRAAAATGGRSLSEEIEFRIERDARAQEQHQADLAQMYDQQTLIGKLQQQNRTLEEKTASDKGSVAMDDERAARIAAAAIVAFTEGQKK